MNKFLFLTFIILVSCNSNSTKEDADTILNKVKDESSIRIDVLDNSQFDFNTMQANRRVCLTICCEIFNLCSHK